MSKAKEITDAQMDTLDHELLQVITADYTLDDEKLEYLNQAALDILEQLESDVSLLVSSGLAAIDSKVNASAEPIRLVKECLLSKWRSLSSQHKNDPVALFRYMLLYALRRVSDSNKVILYLAVINPLKFLGNPKEIGVLEKLLLEFQCAYKKACELTSESPTSQITFSKMPEIDLSDKTDTLDTGFAAAFQNGNPISNNQSYGQNIIFPQWAKATASGIAETIQSSFQSIATELDEQLQSIKIPVIDASFIKTSNENIKEKLNVLWWLQTRFSPNLKRRYRTLSVWSAAAIMAVDLHEMISYPVSPEAIAVLEEAIFTAFGEKAEESSTLVEGIKEIMGEQVLGQVILNASTPLRVLPRHLAELSGVKNSISDKVIGQHFGFSGKLPLSPMEFAVWYLRTLSLGTQV